MTPLADPMVGRALGDFVIRERIGAGGVGEVFRAEQVTLGREAVIKVLTRTKDTGTEAAERFLREARLASRLDHPFAAHVYAFGAEPDGLLWIAMELVRGIPLDRLINTQGPLPLSRFGPFFERLAEVLNAAHEQGIIHRDVKPANVMVLSRTGRLLPKLLDLGIARSDTTRPVTVEVEALSGDQHLSEAEVPAGSDALLISQSSDITQAGMLIGTPHFMAPEQWSDASRADLRSDVYSLGVLAYQAITGRLPFKGQSIRSMARAHAQQALPPLGDELPEGLYTVLAKATAKQSSARYASTLEFAEAFRAAANLELEPASLPQLDDGLRETVLAKAPQPIAEAVALVEAARTAKQAVEALASAQRVVTRHLSMMALAARARVGAGAEADSDDVVSQLKRLALGRLDDDAWRTLTTDLCRPFATRPEAYPVPELVAVFFTRDSQTGMGAVALSRLANLNWPSPDTAPDELMAFLHQAVPALGQVLSTLSFLFDYPMVVRREDAERWMGTRRRRSAQDVLGRPPGDGEVALLDAAGALVLTLSPLMQLIAPTVGAPHELFYLDGHGRHGARLISLPGPFERQDPDLWSWFSKHITDVLSPEATVGRDEFEPYKGLSPFTAKDADNYFGREREAEGFANRLRAEPLLAVVGPSGAGKSSFVVAGVLPLLPKTWRCLVVRPGNAPLAALAHRLGIEQLGGDDLLPTLRADPLALGTQVGQKLKPDEVLVLVVDQFEELVTLCADVDERQAFARALTSAADLPGRQIRVVMTLRDDFLIQITQISAFRERLSNAVLLLATPAPEDLLRTVTEPARRVGFGFDDETLPKRMVDAVLNHSGALALLSFTASQLWRLRDRTLRQMRAKTYEAIGGVGGALAHHAEATLALLPPGQQHLVREAFRQLVTSQSTRALLSKSELLEVLGNDDTAQTVLDALVNARLLITSEGEDEEDRVELIHESLIASWPRLVTWLREEAETVRLRDALRASARQWEERSYPRGLLWRDETLAEYQVWKTRFFGGLTHTERAFAAASLRQESRGRLLRRALAIVAFAALTVGLVLVSRAYRQADAARAQAELSAREAKQRLASLRQEQGRLSMLDRKPQEALAYLDAARAAGAQGPALEHLLTLASWLTRGELRRFGDGKPIVNAVLSPDEQTLAIFRQDGQVVLWHVATGTVQTQFEASATAGAFAADGSLVLGTTDGHLEFIDSVTGTRTSRVDAGSQGITALELGATGEAIAVSTMGETARILRRSGEVITSHTVPKATALSVRLSPDGRWAAFFAGPRPVLEGSTRELRLVDAASGQEAWRLTLPAPVRQVAFGPNQQLAIGLDNGQVSVWQLTSKQLRWQRPGEHAGALQRLEFSPNGSKLLSLGTDGKAVVWRSDTGAPVHALALANGPLRHGFWAREPWVMVELPDGALVKINADTGELDWRFIGQRPRSMQWPTQHGTQMVSVQNGVVRVWNLRTSGGPAQLTGHRVSAVFGSPTSAAQVIQANDGWYVASTPTEPAVRVKAAVDAHQEVTAAISANAQVVARLNHGALQLLGKETNFDVTQTITSGDSSFFWFVIDSAGQHLAAQTVRGEVVLLVGPPFVERARLEQRGRTPGFFARGELITSSADGALERWNAETGVLVARTQSSDGFVFPTPVAAQERYLTTTSTGAIHVRALQTAAKIATVAGLGVEPLALALDEPRSLLHEWTADGSWSTWELTSRRLLTQVRTVGPLVSAAVTTDGVSLVTTAGTLVRWPAQTPHMSAEEISTAIKCGSLELGEQGLVEREPSQLLRCTRYE